MNVTKRALAVVGLVVLASACTSTGDADTTTSSQPGPLTTVTTTTTETVDTTSTTLAPLVQVTPPEYQIVGRAPIEGAGDEVVVLLDPTSYQSLTDIDIYDLIAEVVELFPPVTVLHLVDDAAAANIVADPEASEAQRQSIVDNYFARLDDGFKVTYLGPFASSGSAVLGS